MGIPESVLRVKWWKLSKVARFKEDIQKEMGRYVKDDKKKGGWSIGNIPWNVEFNFNGVIDNQHKLYNSGVEDGCHFFPNT